MKNESTVTWSKAYPKDKDLKFWKMMGKGDYQEVDMPVFSYDEVVYNEKNLKLNRKKKCSTLIFISSLNVKIFRQIRVKK